MKLILTEIQLNNLRMGGVSPRDNIIRNNIFFNENSEQHSMHLTDGYGEEILDFGMIQG